MARCRPAKWVIPWVLLGAGLPWLAAAWINSSSLKADIAARASNAVAGNESTAWAQLDSDGRDFVVSGTSPSQEAADAAVAAVANTYGVRTAMASPQLKIVPPAPPPPPLQPAALPAGRVWPYPLTGTWPEGPGASLTARLDSRDYVLGRDPALTSDGKGNFTFAPTETLQPGSYDVDFTARDAAGVTTTAKLSGAVLVPAPVPAPEAAAPEAAAPAAATQAAATPVAEPAPAEAAPAEPPAQPAAPEAAVAPEQPVAQAETPAVTPAPAIAMAAPTVERQLDLTGLPIVRGTWPEGAASGLDVALGGRTYTLGRDANLAAREGTWSLIPSAGLKDGIYDVVVTATGADGTTARDEGVAEIEVDAIPPAAPVVTAYAGEGSPAAVTGTWPEGQASGLKVTIPQAKLTAELGTPASPLTSDGGGNWSFALPAQLAPGSYDVEVSATDNRGRVLTSTAAGGLVIAAVPPPPPPVPKIGLYAAKPAADATWPFAITGRWSEGTAIDLTAELAGRRYALGRDAELTSDGTGRFTFAPQADSAPPGQNIVTFSSKGPAGDTRIAEVLITVPAPTATEEPEPEASASPPQPAQPVVAEKPFSCETVLSRLNQVFPVRFGFNRAKLEGIASLSLSQYAALLKDPRCASLKLEIGGHADYYGPESYNVWLSELRANTVLAALKEAGISDANISIKGYGESSPLDPAQTTEARQKNRRVEFTAVK